MYILHDCIIETFRFITGILVCFQWVGTIIEIGNATNWLAILECGSKDSSFHDFGSNRVIMPHVTKTHLHL